MNKDVEGHDYQDYDQQQYAQRQNPNKCVNTMFGLLLFYSLALTGFMFMQQKNIENFYQKFEAMQDNLQSQGIHLSLNHE